MLKSSKTLQSSTCICSHHSLTASDVYIPLPHEVKLNKSKTTLCFLAKVNLGWVLLWAFASKVTLCFLRIPVEAMFKMELSKTSIGMQQWLWRDFLVMTTNSRLQKMWLRQCNWLGRYNDVWADPQ